MARWLFGIDPRETGAVRRGFPDGVPETRVRLDSLGRTFVEGYHAALTFGPRVELARCLDDRERDLRGFAYEGAGMGLALVDLAFAWKRQLWRRFHDWYGDAQTYLLHVGLGWALARAKRPLRAPPDFLDPLLGWLAIDGRGFHDSFFGRPPAVPASDRGADGGEVLAGAYHAGIGRSLWFVHAGDVAAIARAVGSFSLPRQADVWSGIGLAAAYAGGVDDGRLRQLTAASAANRGWLAQGVVFAAKARVRAGDEGRDAARACAVIARTTLADAARLADEVHDEAVVVGGGAGAAAGYRHWRRELAERLALRTSAHEAVAG